MAEQGFVGQRDSEMASKAAEIEVANPDDEKKSISKVDDPEIGSVEEPPKTFYSTLSVWLMILFSGLASGSDG